PVAACGCVDNLVWVRRFLKELLVDLDVSTVYCDNQSALQAIANRGNSTNICYYDRFAKEAQIVAEFVDEGMAQLEYVPSSENLAHIFTKALGPGRFEYLRDKLNMENVVTAWNNVQIRSNYQ
ncbi:putative integrase catalytic domain-containing protein, partial [Phytophthora infestans]